jgi:hypothetical protein
MATHFVAKARPDGYSLVMLAGANTASSFPFVVAVRAEHPAKTLDDLMAMARQEPARDAQHGRAIHRSLAWCRGQGRHRTSVNIPQHSIKVERP